MSKNPDDFGDPIGGTRWFRGEPVIEEKPQQAFRQRWLCPIDECGGEMVSNGMMWPTGTPGYHHTCDKCGFTAAMRGINYPRTVYR